MQRYARHFQLLPAAKVHVGGALALLLVGQVGLLQHVLALVVEDQVRALGVAALVRAEHDVVRRGVAEGLGVAELRPDLHVAAAALDVLLVLGLVLDDQLLARIAEGVKARGEAEEPPGLPIPMLGLPNYIPHFVSPIVLATRF